MKGAYGLVLAIVLGLVGGIFNWAYLENRSSDEEKVAMIGIKPDVEIERGQRLEESQLVPVEIPRRVVGNLKDFAVPYSALPTVVGRPVWRHLAGGSLLLEQDLRTPPQELKIAENERVIWVAVDPRTFVPSLVTPGVLVSFRASAVGLPQPTLVDTEVAQGSGSKRPRRPSGELIGPFKVLSLGNRLGSSEVLRAARIPQVQENVLAIAVMVDKQGNLAPDAERLLDVIDQSNAQPLRVILHPVRSP